MEFKRQQTKELLERHILYFLQVLQEQINEIMKMESGDEKWKQILELEERVNLCMLELETLGN